MLQTALILVLVAGLVHASWNIAAKKARGDVRFSAFTSWVMLIAWAPLGLYLAWQEVPSWSWLQWACVAVSAVFVMFQHGPLSIQSGQAQPQLGQVIKNPGLKPFVGPGGRR